MKVLWGGKGAGADERRTRVSIPCQCADPPPAIMRWESAWRLAVAHIHRIVMLWRTVLLVVRC